MTSMEAIEVITSVIKLDDPKYIVASLCKELKPKLILEAGEEKKGLCHEHQANRSFPSSQIIGDEKFGSFLSRNQKN